MCLSSGRGGGCYVQTMCCLLSALAQRGLPPLSWRVVVCLVWGSCRGRTNNILVIAFEQFL